MPGSTSARAQHTLITTCAYQPPASHHAHHAHPTQRKPRPLFILLSLLNIIVLLHLIAAGHVTRLIAAPTNCMQLIRNTDYTKAVQLQPRSQQIGPVEFVGQLVAGHPAALVQVAHADTQHTLDAYIYGCTMQKRIPKLTVLFAQRGLLQGTVVLSQVQTLLTRQLDPQISAQAATLLQSQQQYLYREYAWHNGTFEQVSFPALYPVTSRGAAEALQQEADSGQSLPWNDPLATAEQMAKDILQWPNSANGASDTNGTNGTSNGSQDTVLSNDGQTARVQLVQQNPAFTVTVTLERLIQHNSQGLWFVVGAQTSAITLNKLPTAVTSPLAIQGPGALSDGQTTATLFDHTLTALPSSSNVALNVNTNGAYTGALAYTGITPNQQGLLLIQSVPPAGSTEAGQLLLMGIMLG